MNEDKQLTGWKLFLCMITNPIFIIVYGISFYELYTLCQFGRMNHNILILGVSMIFFLAWYIFLIYRIIKNRLKKKQGINTIEKSSPLFKVWRYIGIILIVCITAFYGVKIYNSAVNLNGKLAWHLFDIEHKRTIDFNNNNAYKTGVDGIFEDINKELSMPKKLYMVNNFSLKFNSDGKITSFDTFLYGENGSGKLETFLITYDINKSKKITIYLNGEAGPNYNDDKLIEPLIKTMKVIPLKDTVSRWDEKQFGILYNGKRSFGYNTQGIVYIDKNGNTRSAVDASSELEGYFVSVYVPGKEDKYIPVRYDLVSDSNKANEDNKINSVTEDKEKDTSNESTKSNGTDKFYLSKEVGYSLEVTGAAMGSRSYSLNKTTDGGVKWNVINEIPFGDQLGVAAGITFLDEKLGFICLSKSGGSYGELFRTEDGGVSFQKVDIPVQNVTVGGQTYNPFDLPGMPYKKDGTLNILIGQGSDGDYNGGCKALYQSTDNGKTWQYVKEVTADSQ